MHPRTITAGIISFLFIVSIAQGAGGVSAGPKAAKPVPEVQAANVLLVANGNFEGSLELVRYYADKRSIPQENILVINTPTAEQVDRKCFNSTIRDPIRAAVAKTGGRIRCIVLFYGVPLRIWDPLPVNRAISRMESQLKGAAANQPLPLHEDTGAFREKIKILQTKAKEVAIRAASVDSELALLDRDHPLEKWVRSPFPKCEGWPEGCYWVARLDASSVHDVRAMIDGALTAEREGLKGTAYFDARGLAGTRAYARADRSIERAAHLTGSYGLTTVLDKKPELFGRSACPQAAIYWGWYSLSKYVDSFEFVPGAIAVHIASGECDSLRHGTYWCRNLIAHGAAVTMGPTNEPYLQAFPPPDDFLGMLYKGSSVGRAYYATQKWLSWRMVLLGDPLYRPFATVNAGPREMRR